VSDPVNHAAQWETTFPCESPMAVEDVKIDVRRGWEGPEWFIRLPRSMHAYLPGFLPLDRVVRIARLAAGQIKAGA
jgi:hypothetical protein